jgi:hypothetical protein
MAKAIRIEQLLLHNPSTTTGTDRPRPRTPLSIKQATPKRQPTRPQGLALKILPISPVSATSPETERSPWRLDKGEPASSKSRKRKSPVDEDTFVAPNRANRPPRFSVNIFHSEPVNAFPIPNEGVVPRMVKYCRPESFRFRYLHPLILLPDLQVWAPQHGRALAFEGHPRPYQSLVFPHALQHGLLFESMIALARSSWLLQERIPWQTDTALAYHRTNAFAGLRLRLTSEATCADDTTILTIAALTTIDVGCKRSIAVLR